MEAKSTIKYVRISPLKVRTLVSAVKVLSPQVALDRLMFSQTRSAKVLYKAIKSAVANAGVGADAKSARFKVLKIDEGPVLKRYRVGSKGSSKPYQRKSSHISVVLEFKDVVKAPVAQKASEKPAVQKQEAAEKSVTKTKVTKKLKEAK